MRRDPMIATQPLPVSEFDMSGAELESVWQGEVNRRSRDYVRWVQGSLNRILGLRLAVDGVLGPKTRSAIRDFQRKSRLAVDGIVGTRTERALVAAGAHSPPGTRSSPRRSTPPPSPAPLSGLRSNIVRIATQEWERWARGSIKEAEVRAQPMLRDYWQTGTGKPYPGPRRAWSSVFISWVMKKAGAGNAFHYSPAHVYYVAAAKRNRLANNRNPYKAYRVTEIRPQVGDLVCAERKDSSGRWSGVNYDNVDDGRFRAAHCDVVTEVRGNRVTAIGGNVRNSVSKKTIRVDPSGRITLPHYFAVIRVGMPGPSSTPIPTRPISRVQPTVTTRPGVGSMPQGPFGTLILGVPGRRRFTYSLTPEDALWTARFIVGEAGGRDDADNRAVIWAMFNRYALFTHRQYPTFHQFLRAYSTPLQPVLRSWGAARRHMHRPQFVRTGGSYAPPHDDVPRGQLDRHLRLQRTPWSRLASSARSLAEQALKGQVPNPIGNASEFGSTYVYFHDRHGRYPNDEEWRQYTQAYARKKGWTWIGMVPGLNQRKNAFFVQQRVADLPRNAVRVIPPR
jgi:hypothetical protein